MSIVSHTSRRRPPIETPASSCLDDESTFALDRGNALGHAVSLATELRASWASYSAPDLRGGSLRRVVFAGMGGSGTASEYAAVAHTVDSRGEASVVHGADLPHGTGPNDLVIVTSYSGDTAESLSIYHQATRLGATVVAVTNGGRLADLARRDGVPLLLVRYDSSPRAALPHLLSANLRTLDGMAAHAPRPALVDSSARAHAAVTVEIGASVPLANNAAKQLALELAGTLPIIIAAGHLLPAARRLKNQLAENSKLYATLEEFPEMAHNAIEALAAATDRGGPRLFVVLLESRRCSPLHLPRDGAREALPG